MLKGSAIKVLRNVYDGENEKQKDTISFFQKSHISQCLPVASKKADNQTKLETYFIFEG